MGGGGGGESELKISQKVCDQIRFEQALTIKVTTGNM